MEAYARYCRLQVYEDHGKSKSLGSEPPCWFAKSWTPTWKSVQCCQQPYQDPDPSAFEGIPQTGIAPALRGNKCRTLGLASGWPGRRPGAGREAPITVPPISPEAPCSSRVYT